MQYLVKFTRVETRVTKKELAAEIKEEVFPSFETLIGWEKENIATGGVAVGKRELVFVINAESNEDLDNRIKTLPFWGGVTTEITPLTSVEKRLENDKALLQKLGL